MLCLYLSARQAVVTDQEAARTTSLANAAAQKRDTPNRERYQVKSAAADLQAQLRQNRTAAIAAANELAAALSDKVGRITCVDKYRPNRHEHPDNTLTENLPAMRCLEMVCQRSVLMSFSRRATPLLR